MRLILIALAAALLQGHSWYDAQCCSENDCRPVEKGEVTRTAEGWLIKPHDRNYSTLIPFGDQREKQSLDVNMHICVGNYLVFCIYKPDPGT